MSEAFRECLKNRKIIPFPRAKGFMQKELAAAEEDLAEARDRLKNEKYKYAIINSYYSIFHAARALLYSKGFRERSHHCLSVALYTLYVAEGKLDKRFVRLFNNCMYLRERADYAGSFSVDGAEIAISNAQEFLDESVAILFEK
jgi:uncharacterized protein (UPF0332 family)